METTTHVRLSTRRERQQATLERETRVALIRYAVKHGLGFDDLIVKFKLSPDEAKRYVFGRWT